MSEKCYIYQIRNLVNNKIYIGSTRNFSSRKSKHKKDLENNRHHSILLQRAYNKYGHDNLVLEIVEEFDGYDKQLEKEQYYIDKLEPQYNICKTAGNCAGTTRSENAKNKDAYSNKKYIIQYDKSMNFIREWHGIRDCANKLNICESAITECCNGRLKSCGGFTFRYKGYKNWKFNPRNPYVRKYSDDGKKQRMQAVSSKTFLITKPNGEEIIIKNLKQFCRDNNINHSGLYNVSAGFKKSYKGYKVKRIYDEN